MSDVRDASIVTSTEDGWIEFSGSPLAVDKTNTYLSVYCSSSSETTLHRAFGFFDLRPIPRHAVIVTQPLLYVNVLSSSVAVGASQSIYVSIGSVIGSTLETGDWDSVQGNAIETLTSGYFNTTGQKSIGLKRNTIKRGLAGILNVSIRALPESGTSTIQLESVENTGTAPMRIDFRYYVPDDSYPLYSGMDLGAV